MLKVVPLFGFRWSVIAGRLPGRTANDVKNYWNCHLSKKLSAKQIRTDSEENTDIGSEQIMRPQPLDLSGIISPRPGSRAGPEEAPTYYPQLEPPLPEVSTSTQFLGDQPDFKTKRRRAPVEEENSIVLGDLPMEFQFDDVRIDGFGSNKQRWDWDDLFMDIDLWSSSL
ncbi:hypothetical protein CDL15_Pgr000808 [Punica granatum]|uniref:Uncharacterized protein n=1 Tax=Punica granatum TaxID=22663 RepID=A0A218W3Z9_PUNGR|nr:hypothetical protein CDL15_Pgr000808 [Punica granatum]